MAALPAEVDANVYPDLLFLSIQACSTTTVRTFYVFNVQAEALKKGLLSQKGDGDLYEEG